MSRHEEFPMDANEEREYEGTGETVCFMARENGYESGQDIVNVFSQHQRRTKSRIETGPERPSALEAGAWVCLLYKFDVRTSSSTAWSATHQ